MIRIISTFIFLTLFQLSASAADPEIFSKKSSAIRGYDPVAYFDLDKGADAVKGSKEFSHDWKGTTWYFSSAENKDKFVDNPEKFAPQYGGYCAFAVSHGFTKPTDPDAWYIHDDKLYLNLSKGVQKKWFKDIPGNIQRADNNWPSVLDK